MHATQGKYLDQKERERERERGGGQKRETEGGREV